MINIFPQIGTPRRKGFTLIFTISLLVLLTFVGLAQRYLSSVTMRTSTQDLAKKAIAFSAPRVGPSMSKSAVTYFLSRINKEKSLTEQWMNLSPKAHNPQHISNYQHTNIQIQ